MVVTHVCLIRGGGGGGGVKTARDLTGFRRNSRDNQKTKKEDFQPRDHPKEAR